MNTKELQKRCLRLGLKITVDKDVRHQSSRDLKNFFAMLEREKKESQKVYSRLAA